MSYDPLTNNEKPKTTKGEFVSQILIGFFSVFLNLIPYIGSIVSLAFFGYAIYQFTKPGGKGYLIGLLIAVGLAALLVGLCFAILAGNFH
jgi:hypothetical protein